MVFEVSPRDKIMIEVFSRMLIDENHIWAKFATYEVNKIIEWAKINPPAKILDVGCGVGRHSLQFGKLGFNITGIDISEKLINRAASEQSIELIDNVSFFCLDARNLDLLEKNYDLIICLYDVIGASIESNENETILDVMYEHLRPGGYAVISVMSYMYTLKRAKYKFSGTNELYKLLELPVSNIMEKTGNVFDPNYYLVDTKFHIIYRKEKFQNYNEELVGDKRYTMSEIINMCTNAGFSVCFSKAVKAGNWTDNFGEVDTKEILVFCKK